MRRNESAFWDKPEILQFFRKTQLKIFQKLPPDFLYPCDIEKTLNLVHLFQSAWDFRVCEIKLYRQYEKDFSCEIEFKNLKICCRQKFLCKMNHSAGFYHPKSKNETIIPEKFQTATKLQFLKSLSQKVVLCTLIRIIQTICHFWNILWKQTHLKVKMSRSEN